MYLHRRVMVYFLEDVSHFPDCAAVSLRCRSVREMGRA